MTAKSLTLVASLVALGALARSKDGQMRLRVVDAQTAAPPDDAVSAPANYARKNNIKWVQGFLGPWAASAVTPLYGVDGIPSIFLIDPEGKIIQRDLRGDAIGAAVERALGNR